MTRPSSVPRPVLTPGDLLEDGGRELFASAHGRFPCSAASAGMTAAASHSLRPLSAAHRSSPAASPSPVTWSRR